MAVPFTFGQSLLQGLQLGQQNRRAQEELAFRKDVQQAAEDLSKRQQDEIERYNKSTERYRDTSLGADIAFKGANYDLNRKNLSLAEQAQKQLFGQYVDIPGPDGQTAQINIKDLLSDQRMRESLRLQRRATDPFTITNQQIGALRNLSSGQPIEGGSVTLPYQFAGIGSQYAGVAADDILQAQRNEARYQIEGTQAARTAAESAMRTAPTDPSRIASPDVGLLGTIWRGIMGEDTTEAQARVSANNAAKATTVPEFERVLSEQEQLLEMMDNIPVELSGQAGPIADRAISILGDANSKLDDANIPEAKKRELRASILKLGQYFTSRASRANPSGEALGAAYQKAIQDEDYDTAAQIQKLMTGNQ